MKEDKKDSGQELIDIDEKGNPIEKEKEEKKKELNPNSSYKLIIGIILCLIIIVSCCCCFNSKKNIKSIFDQTTLKNLKLKNRVFFGPIAHDIQKIESIIKNNISLAITDGAIVGDASTKLKKEGTFMIDSNEHILEIKKIADMVINMTHTYY